MATCVFPTPPSPLPEREILDLVDPAKDVDGFHPVNVGRMWLDQDALTPATPTGILEDLRVKVDALVDELRQRAGSAG
jgi:5,10-methylene-tetrahydrofolate dehydrogenase/methenyl tetrahydrofolate cyclohydrolase